MENIEKPVINIQLLSENEEDKISAFEDGGAVDIFSDDFPLEDESDDDNSTDVFSDDFILEDDNDEGNNINNEPSKEENYVEVKEEIPEDNSSNVVPVYNNVSDIATTEANPNEPVPFIDSPVEAAKIKTEAVNDINSKQKEKAEKDKEFINTKTLENLDKIEDDNKEELEKAARVDNNTLEELKKKSFKKFGNDLVFMSYFMDDQTINKAFSNPELVKDISISDMDDLWKDPFVKTYFQKTYGANGLKEFEKVYDNVIDKYHVIKNNAAKQSVINDQLKGDFLTGNVTADLLRAGSQEERDKISDIYSSTNHRFFNSYTSKTGFVGHQFINSGVMSGTSYQTAYDAAADFYTDIDGNTYEVNESNIEDAEKQNKWFHIRNDIDSINLTDVGSVHMELHDQSQRQRLDMMIVPKYEISDKPWAAQALRRARQAELNGWGDYSSILLTSLYKTGIDLYSSTVSVFGAMANIINTEDSDYYEDIGAAAKNWARKYTPGMTKHGRSGMWNSESVLEGAASGLWQIGLAYGLGGAFKYLSKGFTLNNIGRNTAGMFGQFGTRVALTIYGTGTAYDTFKDNGYSNQEAGLYAMTAFLSMWWANGLSDWVSDGFTNKALLKDFGKVVRDRVGTVESEVIKKGLSRESNLAKVYNFFISDEGNFGKALAKAADNKVFKVAGGLDLVKNATKEGVEEMTEDVFNELNQHAANFITWAKGDNDDNHIKYFNNILDDGYLSNLGSQMVFSGTMGAIMGAGPGMLKDTRRILNRKAKDVKTDRFEGMLEVVNSGREEDFFSLLVKMRKRGQLGAEDVRADGSKGKVSDTDISQAEYNQAMILNDYFVTKKTLGEITGTKDENGNLYMNLLPTEAGFDLSLKSKETMRQLFDIYSANDLTYDDYKEIQDKGLNKFNAKRHSNNQPVVTKDVFDQLDKLNVYMGDLKDGTAMRVEFMKRATKSDAIFGSEGNRAEEFKGKQFDDLLYNYFKGVLNNHHSNFEDLVGRLKVINEGKEVVVDGKKLEDEIPLESIPAFIQKYKEIGIMSEEKKEVLIRKANEYLYNSKEMQDINKDLGDYITKFIKDKIKALLKRDYSDFNYLGTEQDIDDKIESLKSVKKDEDGKELPISKEDDFTIRRLRTYKKLINIHAEVDELTDEFKEDLGKQLLLDYFPGKNSTEDIVNADSIYVTDLLEKLKSLEIDNLSTPESLANTFVTVLGDNRFNDNKIVNIKLSTISKNFESFDNKRREIKSGINSISTDNEEDVHRKMNSDLSFLDKILNINIDGTVSNSGINMGNSMVEFLTALNDLLPPKSDNIAEEQELILPKSYEVDELKNNSYFLMVHTRFLDILSKNLRNLNHINNVINRSRQGKLIQAKQNIFLDNKFMKYLQANMWFPSSSRYTVHSDLKNPERNIQLQEIYKRIEEYEKELNKENISNDEKLVIQDKIDVLKSHDYTNFFDYDRMVWLEKRGKAMTESEKIELANFKEKHEMLTSPSLELIKFMNDKASLKAIESNKKLISKLEGDIKKLESDIDTIDSVARENIYSNEYNEVLQHHRAELVKLKKRLEEAYSEKERLENKVDVEADEKLKNLKEEQAKWEEKRFKGGLSKEEIIVLDQNEPYLAFFKNMININNNTLREKLAFYIDFFNKSGNFTIKDKTFISRILFDELSTEDERTKRAGVGANYEVNVKNNFNEFVSNINKMLNEDDLKCKEK